MAQITYSNIKRFRYLDFDDCALENTELNRQRDEILKKYVAKQLCSKIDINEYLENSGKFTSPVKQEDVAHYVNGLSTCLNLEEVNFNSGRSLSSRSSNCNEKPVVCTEQLKHSGNLALQPRVVDNNISGCNSKNYKHYSNSCESPESVVRSSVQDGTTQDPLYPQDHPINHLVELEATLFPKKATSESTCKNTLPRKKIKINNVVTVPDWPSDCRTSLWDVKDIDVSRSNLSNKNIPHIKSQQISQPHSKDSSTGFAQESRKPDLSKPFVWTVDKKNIISLSAIEQNRVDICKIKKNTVFKNYEPGIPSCTLYIKNLPRNLSPIKLVSLFSNFESDNGQKLEYRILNGKMKGQAFVKFANVRTSILAFTTCNGYIIDGKPIVIEYGKQK